MNKAKRTMEGGFRLDSIRRTKRWLYVAQTVIILVFATYLLIANKEVSLNPFHIGIPSFLYFVLIMLIVVMIESFFFLRLELRFLSSPSSKYYLTRDSLRRSLVIVVVALIVMLLFWVPTIQDGVKSTTTTENTYFVTNSQIPTAIKIESADIVSLTSLNKIAVTTDGGKVLAFIVSEENYKTYGASGSNILGKYRVNTYIYTANPGMEYTVQDLKYGNYYLCLYSDDTVGDQVDVTINGRISNDLTNYVPIFMVILALVNVIWFFYLRPIHKVFEQRAIYR